MTFPLIVLLQYYITKEEMGNGLIFLSTLVYFFEKN